jgi:hypothetical protein
METFAVNNRKITILALEAQTPSVGLSGSALLAGKKNNDLPCNSRFYDNNNSVKVKPV